MAIRIVIAFMIMASAFSSVVPALGGIWWFMNFSIEIVGKDEKNACLGASERPDRGILIQALKRNREDRISGSDLFVTPRLQNDGMRGFRIEGTLHNSFFTGDDRECKINREIWTDPDGIARLDACGMFDIIMRIRRGGEGACE